MNALPSRGYIALVSVLIISAILLALTFETSTGSYFARFTTTDMDTSVASKALSDSCGSMALLYLAEDDSYQPISEGSIVQIEERRSCTIDALEKNGSHYVVRTHARVNNVWSDTTILATRNTSSNTLSVDMWR